jgi:hypothetical protein
MNFNVNQELHNSRLDSKLVVNGPGRTGKIFIEIDNCSVCLHLQIQILVRLVSQRFLSPTRCTKPVLKRVFRSPVLNTLRPVTFVLTTVVCTAVSSSDRHVYNRVCKMYFTVIVLVLRLRSFADRTSAAE